MITTAKIDITQDVAKKIEELVEKIIDEEFEEMKRRVDFKRQEVYKMAAIEISRHMRAEIVGEELIFHLANK